MYRSDLDKICLFAKSRYTFIHTFIRIFILKTYIVHTDTHTHTHSLESSILPRSARGMVILYFNNLLAAVCHKCCRSSSKKRKTNSAFGSELCSHGSCGHEPARPAFNTDVPKMRPCSLVLTTAFFCPLCRQLRDGRGIALAED